MSENRIEKAWELGIDLMLRKSLYGAAFGTLGGLLLCRK